MWAGVFLSIFEAAQPIRGAVDGVCNDPARMTLPRFMYELDGAPRWLKVDLMGASTASESIKLGCALLKEACSAQVEDDASS